MSVQRTIFIACMWLACTSVSAFPSIFGAVQGIAHDPQHRPIAGATVVLQATNSAYHLITRTTNDGSFRFPAVPLGEYTVEVTDMGFRAERQTFTLLSDASPVLHFELAVGAANESVTVRAQAGSDVGSATPTTLVSRLEIERTPGADRTNSLAMITGFVPGAYVTHDMLHMRGGHQVTWQIDGVAIPNTNIASNVGAQIDPKDIDYLEVQRGSYTADEGDRTYGIFNVVPKNGFAMNREGEMEVSLGSFFQTNDQVSLGSHSEQAAYYVSFNGTRSDYGLSPPVSRALHDASNGFGGFASLLDNKTAKDQLRMVGQLRTDFFQIPYDPDPNSEANQVYRSTDLRDTQRETDGLLAFTWAHTFSPRTVLQVSPFYHYNRADYEPRVSDMPVETTSDRSSHYAGVQAAINTEIKRNTLQAGVYGFGQRDSNLLGAVFHDGSATNVPFLADAAAGGVVEEFISDSWKVASWLTLTGGLRESRFQGSLIEQHLSPRVGVAVMVPKAHIVFRGFYGRFYQPPPLITASGPIVTYAESQNVTFSPLQGEQDEEHQFGMQVPLAGWVLDANTFKTRAKNFLDHSNLGESSIYYPVTIDGALVRGWEVTLRSPQLWHHGQAHLAYSNQIGEQRGAITGGLICYPVGSPECSKDFTYSPLDHDQRNTLNVGYSMALPGHGFASTDVSYGSGFHNGLTTAQYPDDYLPGHTSFDLAFGKQLNEQVNLSINALNVANRRTLLDNSLTFGGFHYGDPRQIYAELRYHFHY